MSTVHSKDQYAAAHKETGAAAPAAETLVPAKETLVPAKETLVPAKETPIPAMHKQPTSTDEPCEPSEPADVELNLDLLITDKDRTKTLEAMIGCLVSCRPAELIKLRGAINNLLAEEREEDEKNYRDCPRVEVVGELVTALWYEFNGLI